MLHLARVEDRAVARFPDLAARFGRMAAEGILIDVRLTHEIIGQLLGSRRPAITFALHSLDAEGVLSRVENDRGPLARAAIAP